MGWIIVWLDMELEGQRDVDHRGYLSGSENAAGSNVLATMRREVFVFPRNLTVAEVIEMDLRDNGPAVRNDLLKSVQEERCGWEEAELGVEQDQEWQAEREREKEWDTHSSLDGDRRSVSIPWVSLLWIGLSGSAQSARWQPVALVCPCSHGCSATIGPCLEQCNLFIALVILDLSEYDTAATHPSTLFLAPLSLNRHSYTPPTPMLKQQSGQQELKLQQVPQRRIMILTQGQFQAFSYDGSHWL